MSIWKTKSSLKETPWGSTNDIDSLLPAKGKIIRINADQRTSLKFYPDLEQTLYCLSGKVVVHAPKEKEFGDYSKTDGNYFELLPGDLINIQSSNSYRLEAQKDSVLIEVSAGLSSLSKKVMIEDDYGRIPKKIIGE